MASHYEVAERFAKRGNPLRGSHVFADSKQIYSYGHHFPMAFANDERKLFVVNGDTYGPTTSRHQRDVRSAIESTTYASVSIPFTVINRAGIAIESIEVIETGNKVEVFSCNTCGEHFTDNESMYNHKASLDHKVRYQHLMEPSLVKAIRTRNEPLFDLDECDYCDKSFAEHQAKGEGDFLIHHTFRRKEKKITESKYFLSAFDETARAWNGGYFFSELPRKVKTIEEAFTVLRPKPVREADAKGISVRRQGDILAIPTDLTTRQLSRKGTHLPEFIVEEKVLLDWENKPFHTERTVTDRPVPNTSQYIRNGYRPQLLGTNHYATEAFAIGKNGHTELYARGILYHKPEFREADHRDIKLGKVWHRIYRNTAVASWSVSGNVD